jgi:integrase
MTRGSSGGMIRKHPIRDLWEGRYVDTDGRRRSVYASTRRQAQERLRLALSAVDQGIRPIGQQATVGVYLDDWIASVRVSRRPRTADSYAETVERYIKPAIGKAKLAKLDPAHIGTMLANLSTTNTARGPLSPTTVRYVHTILRIALGRAFKSGLVGRNVASLVDPPRRADVQISPLTGEQVGILIDSLQGHPLRALFITAIGTGLRQGELLGLRWADVDIESGTLTVRHTLQRGTRTLAEPKTERGRRTLRLPGEAWTSLREHRRQQLEARVAKGSRWVDEDFVFTTRNGRPLAARNVLRSFHGLLQQAGLPSQRFHDLRHAYATLLLEDGEELGVISRTLGHSQIATTADIYAHVTPAMLERTAARMDGVLLRRTRAV